MPLDIRTGRWACWLAVAAVIGALTAPSWAACLKEAAPSAMACCEAVTSDCSQMEPAMMCCSTGGQTNRESNAARLAPVAASVMAPQHAGFAVWMPLPAVVPIAVAAGLIDLPPTPPHLIHSVLLI